MVGLGCFVGFQSCSSSFIRESEEQEEDKQTIGCQPAGASAMGTN
jgi:hypothetical protein